MQVMHFTAGAGDPLWDPRSRGVGFVPIAQNDAGTHIACLHLSTGAKLDRRSLPCEGALLVIQGEAAVTTDVCRLDLLAGVGIALKAREWFCAESKEGAVLLLIECRGLEATDIAVSTPDRIRGQRWPGEGG
jgi:hypothetical protein